MSKEKLERLVTLDFNVDEESELLLTNSEEILDEPMKRNEELKVVGEYFRTNAPILHQSPFNEEAVWRYPILCDLTYTRTKSSEIKNSSFPTSIIRVL